MHVQAYGLQEFPSLYQPVWHDAHLGPSLMHADPVAGDPLLHVQAYGLQEFPSLYHPVLHDAHLGPLIVHADPVAGDPLLHVQAYDLQEFPSLYHPVLHDAQLAALCVGQAVPVVPVPSEHVQTLVLHSRFRVVVGDVDSY